jgi:CHASE2 domain-containing sensor protein
MIVAQGKQAALSSSDQQMIMTMTTTTTTATVTMTATAHSATVAAAPTKQMTAFRIIYSIISFAVSVYAVYLSWSCNSAANVNVLLKVIYAFFAFIFGFLYLIFYFIFRAGTCTTLKGAAAASNVVVGGRRRFYKR